LADGNSLPRKQAEAMLGDLVTLTTGHMKQGYPTLTPVFRI
jgi:hypothetical protein